MLDVLNIICEITVNKEERHNDEENENEKMFWFFLGIFRIKNKFICFLLVIARIISFQK
jgi:hypothetical protein